MGVSAPGNNDVWMVWLLEPKPTGTEAVTHVRVHMAEVMTQFFLK